MKNIRPYLPDDKPSSTSIFLVCEDDRKIVGTIEFEIILDEIHLYQINVDANHRRQGIAESLICAMLAKYPRKKILLEVSEQNIPAIALYKKMGFTEVGFRPHYYKNGDSAILMTKTCIPF